MNTLQNVSLLRRLGAMIYDTVLAGFSVVIVSSLPATAIQSFTGYRVPDAIMALLYLLLTYGFFTWFWTHGGQTLGMRAWKVRVVTEKDEPLNQQQATSRFLWAIASWASLGLGFVVSLFDKDKLAWHDRYSHTKLIFVPKKST